MKKTILFLLGVMVMTSFTACSPEEDIKNPDFQPYKLFEDFTSNTTDGAVINLAGWTNFAEAGTVKWNQGIYYSDKYAEFSSFQSGQSVNIAWLVSPKVNVESNSKLAFDVAQAYVSTAANSIELLVSTDFDGTNVTAANWTVVNFTKPPLNFDTNFDFFSSGLIDLSAYANQDVYLAFKVKGSGTNTSLDGTYSIDNVRIINKN
jgi:Domain of unknown function (DUF5017)